MENRIRLSDLELQSDGIRSSKSVEQIIGFQPSKLYSLFDQIPDFSANNKDLINPNLSFEQTLALSPMRANCLRAFEWDSVKNILEIGCGSGALTYFLAEKNPHVDAIEPNRQQAQLAQIRTKTFPQVSVFSERFHAIDFSEQKYDVVILNGITDHAASLMDLNASSYVDAVKSLLSLCANLLNKDGQLFLAADNRQGLKYVYGETDERVQQSYFGFNGYQQHQAKQTLNLSEWRSLINDSSFDQVVEYYLFPDYRFASVLLGKDYCQNNQYAFQHLEGIRSKDYFQYQALGVNEILLYQGANAHGHLGDFANSCLFILSPEKSEKKTGIDFAHLPSFKRRREFASIVKKKSAEDFIRRENLFDHSSTNSEQTEHYQKGCQLSVIWRNSIISDHRGIEFQQLLLRYFDYLKKLDSGVYEGFNIDAIANNIIVDENDHYQLIDREWLDYEQGIDVAYIFYRAVVHFALRNESIFYHFNWVKGISTLSDFIFYCFKTVGCNSEFVDLEKMREQDIEFLSHVLLDSDGYELTDVFGSAMVNRPIYPTLSWRGESGDYKAEQSCVVKANPDNKVQWLTFRLGKPDELIKALRFQPFLHLQALEAGYFDVSQLDVVAINAQDNKRSIFTLETSNDVYQANTNSAVFHAENETQSHFMFQTAHTFLEFEMPAYQLADDEELQIEMDFRLSPSLDYEIARAKFTFVDRQMAEQLRIKDEQFQVLDKKHKKLQKEVKASRIWRLLEAYRDTFKISGYPQKNLFGKVRHLVSRFRKSKNISNKNRLH